MALELDRHDAPAQRGKPPGAPADGDSRVLVVDDNPAFLKITGELFREQGMAVSLANSAAQARSILEREPLAFDLVLSDISMPGETGFDLLAWIKRDGSPFAELPVLLTTMQLPEAENRLRGLALGAVDYVVRPIELKELVLRAINAIDHFKRVKNLETLLQNSENLAMVGRLLAAANHEIKNLAALVQVSTELIGNAFPDLGAGNSPQAFALRSLKQSSALLVDVAKNASTLLDPVQATGTAIDIDALVASVVDLMESRTRPLHVQILKYAGDPRWGFAHAVRLKQVLINLILNASDAIAEIEPTEGGHIVLAVRPGEAGTIQITVKDNGIGLSQPGERTEFQPFLTTKKLRGGQGLGLWLSARLTRIMGGHLALQSDGVGQGATAVVTLRAAAPVAATDRLDLSQYLID